METKKIKYVCYFLALLFILVIISNLEKIANTNSNKSVLSDNPNDIWIGGTDGGYFLEILTSAPPIYCILVKNEQHVIIAKGQVRYEGEHLAKAKFNYLLDDEIGLLNGARLPIEPAQNCK